MYWGSGCIQLSRVPSLGLTWCWTCTCGFVVVRALAVGPLAAQPPTAVCSRACICSLRLLSGLSQEPAAHGNVEQRTAERSVCKPTSQSVGYPVVAKFLPLPQELRELRQAGVRTAAGSVCKPHTPGSLSTAFYLSHCFSTRPRS